MHFCYESEKTVSGPICSRIVALYHQNSQSVEKKTRILKLSKVFIKSMASVGSVLHLPLNNERLYKLTENYVVSNAKIKRALGIEKMTVTAEEGMRKLWQV